jgi:hypothetical protein
MTGNPGDDVHALGSRLDQPAESGKPAEDTLAATPSPSVPAGALILARIRAVGYAPAAMPADALLSASAAAAFVDRQLIEISDHTSTRRILLLGWADGATPDPELHPSAPPPRLQPVPHLVWAVCLAAAWPQAAAEPYPGHPFSREQILRVCLELGAHDRAVTAALDRTLPRTGLTVISGSVGRLGPAAAALPTAVWSALRRVHDRLPHAALLHQAASAGQATVAEDMAADAPPTARRLPSPPASPISGNDTTVRAVVTALESAQGPVARSDLPALSDPALRGATEKALASCGRALISTPDGRWTTGYLDDIARTLAAEQTGTLTSGQRAVLALILLRAVAIPRAQGRHDEGWAGTDHPVTLDELSANRRLSRAAIADAIRGLRAAGYVATTPSGGYVPGPALARLGPGSQEALWEDLVILGRPDGYMAEKIRRRRSELAAATHNGHLSAKSAGEDQT